MDKMQKTSNHPIVIAISLIALILAISTVLYLFSSHSNSKELCFNFSDASVSVLSVLVALLAGWNIWGTIESRTLDKRFNYAYNKMDYNLGLMYGYFCQMIATNICNVEKDQQKVIMVEYMINSLKTLSKLPGTEKECNSIANTVNEVLENTRAMPILSKDACLLIERIGEIANRDNITGINKIISELTKFITEK